MLSSPELAPLQAMLEAAPPVALAELESVLAAKLHPAPTAAEERVAELGFLAELLREAVNEGHAPEGRTRPWRIPRAHYDTRRPAWAPTSRALVHRWGGTWTQVCRAAHGLLPDGRTQGPGRPWVAVRKGSKAPPRLTREEVLESYRAVARAMGRRPRSAHSYYSFVRARRAEARRAGAPVPRLAPQPTVERFFDSFDELAAAAGFVSAARADGPDPDVLELPLSEAVQRARLLGGSLEWLAGRTESGGRPPAEDARFDGNEFARRRRQAKVPEKLVCDELELPLGAYRQLLKGQAEPTLGMAVALADLIQVQIDLCLCTLTSGLR